MSTSTSIRTTPSPNNPTSPSLLYLLGILSQDLQPFQPDSLQTYKSILTTEQLESIQALPGTLSVLLEVAQHGPYPWIRSVIEVLKSTERSLRGVVEGEDGFVEEQDGKGRLERRDSAEWVVVDDEFGGKEDGKVEKASEVVEKDGKVKEKADMEDVKEKRASLVRLCNVLEAIIPLIPLPASELLPAKQSPIQFREPVTVRDFLGNKFSFPCEYSVTDLQAIIKSRYATGPGSTYIQRGQYEILRDQQWDAPISEEDVLAAKDKLFIVPIVDAVAGKSKQCPKPRCKTVEAGGTAKEVSLHCTACQTWFYNSSKPAAEKTLQISSTNSETVLSSLPYRFSDEAPADEDISAFEFIKTYPLKQLVAADVAEDRIYRCKTEGCGTHLTRRFDIISKNFRGQHGKAYLFSSLTNITRGPSVTRNMTTGKHTICDVYCRACGAGLGWLYEKAEMSTEQYKVGKFLVEMARVVECDEDEDNEVEKEKGMNKMEEDGEEKDVSKVTGREWKGRSNEYMQKEKEMDLLSRVRYVQGELGLEDLEVRLKALMDEENGIL